MMILNENGISDGQAITVLYIFIQKSKFPFFSFRSSNKKKKKKGGKKKKLKKKGKKKKKKKTKKNKKKRG